MLGTLRILSTGLLLVAVVLASPSTSAERRPLFEGGVLFAGGQTRLDLSDHEAVPIPLRPVFAGWTCYIDVTQATSDGYARKITCGGKWGFVDSFVTCGTKHRENTTMLRLRQPIVGKAESDAAEKVTIFLTCGFVRE
jgi:hypothetical protein